MSKKVLDLPMSDNDAGASTIGEYLITLLEELWIEGEGFSGKRPFGNSGWEYELYKPLIEASKIKGSLDGDGYIEDVDSEGANKIILKAIKSLYRRS